ncbi:MAG: alpha/beta hydrolase, partial [Gammaproteobacteria bacterium]|nr:alpha/beta hydrolase [Gammaproteobacteria bacterium]
NSLIIDYRGYGNSSGEPSEEGLYTDARTAWCYLVDERGIPSKHITVFGRSLGGSVAAKLATEVEPAALIVESAFTSVPDAAADIYWWLPVRWLSRFEFATKDYVQQVRCPVLVVHSRDDEIITFSHGRAIFDAAPEPKQFLELRGGHNEAIFESRGVYLQGLQDFVNH